MSVFLSIQCRIAGYFKHYLLSYVFHIYGNFNYSCISYSNICVNCYEKKKKMSGYKLKKIEHKIKQQQVQKIYIEVKIICVLKKKQDVKKI